MFRLSLLTIVLSAGVVLGVATGPATLRAQAPPSSAAHAPSTTVRPAEDSTDAARGAPTPVGTVAAHVTGPWASTMAVRITVPTAAGAAADLDEPHLGGGKNLAMMGVGAAAVGIGLLVGDAAGTGIAIGGGLLGLYGLYRLLRWWDMEGRPCRRRRGGAIRVPPV